MELILFISAIIIMVVSIVSVGFIIVRAARREMHLCASLIKQIEATRQAETKSMNKSLAIASASHDIRASLAGITGLIEICYDEVVPGSQVETNLKQMEACIKDLLGILNSFLDTSKIEAGKMQLEEERFDVAQLVEDVVDLYHPGGIKKGVDVVLDPFDGSLMRFSHVKGDRGKLKQILCNLLSNAVKFTTEGHVTVRAWVQKPSLKNSIAASNRNGLVLRHLCCLFHKNNKAHHDDMETMDDPNAMDFVFEVDDTGKGIPKEKQKAVFENYVQVKETALGLGGTGLGLGIVQSLVRLMHGEIGIVDKEIGEKGSCFRFNVLLSVCEATSYNDTKEENIEIVIDSMDVMHQDDSGITSTQTHSPTLNIQKPSPRLIIHSPSLGIGVRHPSSPKVEGSNVVLLIKNHQRRIISQKFMESLGIKVLVVDQWEQLPHTLKRVKHKLWNNTFHHSLSGKLDFSFHNDCLSKSASGNSSFGANDFPLTSIDANNNYIISLFKKTHLRGASGIILLVIDVTAGPFSELYKIVSKFKSKLHGDFCTCKVVWLANPLLHDRIGFNSKRDIFDSDDIIKYKPFHGTCLYEVVRILPEFGGPFPKRGSARVAETPCSSYRYHEQELHQEGNIQEESEKPLKGKKILIAEDSSVLGKLAKHQTSRLGASVELCENGKEALELVCNGLGKQMKQGGASMILPYDYILMDCKMPIMDGCEATRQIRKIEESYGIHVPIIALTAYGDGEVVTMTIKAGMDAHLCKPLRSEHLLEAIRNIHNALPT
ncbi:histidine kinase CKI1 [Ziziphus jujuba]|uniref:histidine kinase n=1 Tax=Ziziphus jujuba TaxID=326968 RepID=A0ABM3INN5_ZIZJJ|nr:histidine kinase CKI1 [Ziziphus jujuba]